MTAPTTARTRSLPRWSDGGVLTAIAFLLLPVACLAPKQVATLAGLALAGTLVPLVLRLRAGGEWPRLPAAAAVLVALAAWGTVTALWSPLPDRALLLALRLLGFGIGVWVLTAAIGRLDDAARRRLATALLVGGALGAAILAVAWLGRDTLPTLLASLTGDVATEKHRAHIFMAQFNRASAVLAVLAWPLAYLAGRRFGPLAGVATVGVALALLVALNPRSPSLALLAGGGLFVLAWWTPRVAVTAIAATVVLQVALTPVMDQVGPPARGAIASLVDWPISQVHRIAIWEFAAERIAERPIVGWGLGSSRAIPGGDRDIVIFSTEKTGDLYGRALSLHPHNALIQVWLELGLPGVALALALLVQLGRGAVAAGLDRAARATRLATLLTAIGVAQLSFGIWQTWWLAALALSAFLATAVTRAPAPEP